MTYLDIIAAMIYILGLIIYLFNKGSEVADVVATILIFIAVCILILN